MAAWEIIALDTATPQLRAPGTGDTYRFPRSAAFDAGLTLGWSTDLFLARDAANTLALRNGTNAQAFNVYNTYTDASNYERGYFRYVANVLEIGSAAAGTGTERPLAIYSPTIDLKGSVSGRDIRITGGNIIPMSTGNSSLGGTGNKFGTFYQSNFHEMTEQTAPAAGAANTVRIYAEDNGAGKTRLMALFATGAAQQLAVEP